MVMHRRKPFPAAVLLIGLIILLGLAGRALPTEAGSPDQVLLEQVQVWQLENGIQVVLAPAAGSGLSAVNVWVGAGSAQDPPDRQGLAHHLEHMAPKGSGAVPKPGS